MKRIWAGTCVLMLAFGLTGVAFPEGQTKERAPKKEASSSAQRQKVAGSVKGSDTQKRLVVAKVNETEITMNELVSEMDMVEPQLMKGATQRTPETEKKLKETALDNLIFRELAAEEAFRQRINIKPEAIAEAKGQLKASLGSEENYRKYLEKMGYTEESLNRQIEKDKLFAVIAEKEIFQKAKANDKADIEKRKEQWEKALKKKAKIKIFLPRVEQEMLEKAHKGK
jgi:hypothetical protein